MSLNRKSELRQIAKERCRELRSRSTQGERILWDALRNIRSELGSDYGQRLSYASRNIGGTHYIPFAPVSLWLLSDNQPIHSYVIRYTPESKK